MVSLYFHIPFCTRKCDYCHFYVLPDKEKDKDLLMEGFQLEWQHYLPQLKDKEIVSIYFGGGTPALLGAERVGQILNRIPNRIPHCEITLEANPENVSLKLLQEYAQAGINRLSLGVQSLDDTLLKTLTRNHSAEKAISSIYNANEAGISNISIDLMYDLPMQTLETWEKTLSRACELPITHLSLYNLTFEPKTVFYKYRESLQKLIPEPQISREMYQMAVQKLNAVGLNQYEISAFGKPSIHNTGYWTARPFIGFGPSAFSYWEGSRFRNVENLSKYLRALKEKESPIDFSEKLEPEAHTRELLVIELRLLKGVDLHKFNLDSETKKTIETLIQEGFLTLHQSILKMTEKGILFYDTLASELI